MTVLLGRQRAVLYRRTSLLLSTLSLCRLYVCRFAWKREQPDIYLYKLLKYISINHNSCISSIGLFSVFFSAKFHCIDRYIFSGEILSFSLEMTCDSCRFYGQCWIDLDSEPSPSDIFGTMQAVAYISLYIYICWHYPLYRLTHLCPELRSTFAVRETASLGQQMLNATVGKNGLNRVLQ